MKQDIQLLDHFEFLLTYTGESALNGKGIASGAVQTFNNADC